MPEITSARAEATSSTISRHQRVWATATTVGTVVIGLILLGAGVLLMTKLPWVVGVLALVGAGYSVHALLRERRTAKANSTEAKQAGIGIEELGGTPLPH
jgi:threonine/homoserine/homoserine lactone efflux protein